MDLTVLYLDGILPPATIASATSGEPLPEGTLKTVMDACDQAITLDPVTRQFTDFVRSRMVK